MLSRLLPSLKNTRPSASFFSTRFHPEEASLFHQPPFDPSKFNEFNFFIPGGWRGTMGKLITQRLIRAGIPEENICVTTSDPESLSLINFYPGMSVFTDNQKGAEFVMRNKKGIIINPLKQDTTWSVLDSIRHMIEGEDVYLVNLAAGLKKADFTRLLPNTHIILCMMNTALAVGSSVVTYHTEAPLQDFAAQLLRAFGPTLSVSEQKLHDSTMPSGAAPALVYYFIRLEKEFLMSRGYDEETSEEMAVINTLGSIKLYLKQGKSIEDAIDDVACKGGGTRKILETLQTNGMGKTFFAALESGEKRIHEIGESEYTLDNYLEERGISLEVPESEPARPA